jgi:hypothetical protein
VSGLINGDIAFQGGWIFATGGEAVSADTLLAVGQYSVIGPVWPDVNGTDVWFLDTPTQSRPITPALVDFDRMTFVARRSVPLPGLPAGGLSATASSLLRWSTTGFAFRTDLAVFIVNLLP